MYVSDLALLFCGHVRHGTLVPHIRTRHRRLRILLVDVEHARDTIHLFVSDQTLGCGVRVTVMMLRVTTIV
jgi:hypothetical protein